MLVGSIAGSSSTVKAAGDYTNPELILTTVEDIEVFYDDYKVNDVLIDTNLTKNQDGRHIYKITLKQDGYVSLLLSAYGVKKTVEKWAPTYSVTSSDARLTATVYRDSMLFYPVGQTVVATGDINGVSIDKIALDQGTYYIAIVADKYVGATNGSPSVTYVKGTAKLIVYYQQVLNNEIYRPSNVGKENLVSIDREFISLLTVTNPKDYYIFEITDKALVKVNMMYGSTKTAKFVLYSAEREELLTKIVAGNSIWYNVEKYLEPGIYYCSLETITPYDGGQTNLLITQTVYPLKLTQKNEKVNSYITVTTIDAPKEIRYVKGKLTNSELISNKWNSGKVITDVLQFGVNMTGYYTVRVTDEYGNMFMQSINVATCDKKVPNKPIIKTYKAGTFVVSGTAEKSTTVTVTVNGRAYTCTASSKKGYYKCTLPYLLVKDNSIEVNVQDMSGNVSEKAIVSVK